MTTCKACESTETYVNWKTRIKQTVSNLENTWGHQRRIGAPDAQTAARQHTHKVKDTQAPASSGSPRPARSRGTTTRHHRETASRILPLLLYSTNTAKPTIRRHDHTTSSEWSATTRRRCRGSRARTSTGLFLFCPCLSMAVANLCSRRKWCRRLANTRLSLRRSSLPMRCRGPLHINATAWYK